jgi:hypothetical protein
MSYFNKEVKRMVRNRQGIATVPRKQASKYD